MLGELTTFDPAAEEEKVQEAIDDMDALGLEVSLSQSVRRDVHRAAHGDLYDGHNAAYFRARRSRYTKNPRKRLTCKLHYAAFTAESATY